jgi:glycerophosphoryl diester phosphodiesterase
VFSKGWKYRNFLVSSYNYMELQLVQCYDPHIRIALNMTGMTMEYARLAEQIGACALFADKSLLTHDLVEEAHCRELKVFSKVINAENDFLAMQELGVDGMVSDFPDRIVTWRFINHSPSSLLSRA